MTDRDRLIELIDKGKDTTPCNQGCSEVSCTECENRSIADYLLANGVIVPPCKVGDMVYQIKYCSCGRPECYEMKHCYKKDTKRTPKVIDSIMLSKKSGMLADNFHWYEKPKSEWKFKWKPIGTICYKIIQKSFKLEWLTEVGKTIFLTKEEAEKALAERSKNNA